MYLHRFLLCVCCFIICSVGYTAPLMVSLDKMRDGISMGASIDESKIYISNGTTQGFLFLGYGGGNGLHSLSNHHIPYEDDIEGEFVAIIIHTKYRGENRTSVYNRRKDTQYSYSDGGEDKNFQYFVSDGKRYFFVSSWFPKSTQFLSGTDNEDPRRGDVLKCSVIRNKSKVSGEKEQTVQITRIYDNDEAVWLDKAKNVYDLLVNLLSTAMREKRAVPSKMRGSGYENMIAEFSLPTFKDINDPIPNEELSKPRKWTYTVAGRQTAFIGTLTGFRNDIALFTDESGASKSLKTAIFIEADIEFMKKFAERFPEKNKQSGR